MWGGGNFKMKYLRMFYFSQELYRAERRVELQKGTVDDDQVTSGSKSLEFKIM